MPPARVLLVVALFAVCWRAGAREADPPAAPEGDPALMDIAAVVADGNHDTVPDLKGRRVRVRGTVLATPSALRAHGFQTFIDDGTGGVGLYRRDLQLALDPGDRVEAVGRVGQYSGAVQLENVEVTRMGHGALPGPVAASGAELEARRLMGRRVRVEGIAGELKLDAFGTLRLTADDGSAVSVFVPEPLVGRIDWTHFVRGARVGVTGVLSIHKPTWPFDGGYQVVLADPADLGVIARPTPAWQRWAAVGVASAVGLLGLGLLGVHLLQSRQRSRERELRTLSALSTAFAAADSGEPRLARQACEILTAYGIADAVLVHAFDERACLRQLAAAAADPALGGTLDLGDAMKSADCTGQADPQRIQASAATRGLTLLAVHPLPAAAGTLGYLVALSPRRGRPSAMQERTLVAAVKLLAMALENSRIQQRARLEQQQMQQLVITDELTRLYNRRFLDEYLRVQVPLACRRGGGLGFVALDIDHFKLVNDTYGHEAGDRILTGVAGLIREASRSGDVPVRLGGEEFLVVVAEDDVRGAMAFAERLRARIQHHAFDDAVEGGTLQVTVSVGVAVFGMHGDSAAALLRASDEAMYASKRGGRNRVSLAPACEPGAAPLVPLILSENLH